MGHDDDEEQKRKKMTEASASVCLLLASALVGRYHQFSVKQINERRLTISAGINFYPYNKKLSNK